jgi:hypothetical protein
MVGDMTNDEIYALHFVKAGGHFMTTLSPKIKIHVMSRKYLRVMSLLLLKLAKPDWASWLCHH